MIDDFDCRIIHHLTLDGRMSINELSERVNLSQTPVARRVKKLEDNKIITGYTALIDETRLGFSFSVFVSVRLEKQIDDNLAKFERRISTMPEVVDCWLMTGSYDYLLRVVTQNIEDFRCPENEIETLLWVIYMFHFDRIWRTDTLPQSDILSHVQETEERRDTKANSKVN